jgi:hypothetical protein
MAVAILDTAVAILDTDTEEAAVGLGTRDEVVVLLRREDVDAVVPIAASRRH